MDDQPGRDDPLHEQVVALDGEMAQLHAALNPPRRQPNPVLNTIIQMGVGMARLGAPLRQPPRPSPEGARRLERVMTQVAVFYFVIIGGGVLAGYLWDSSASGGALETHLLVGAVSGFLGGAILGMLGWMMGYVFRSTRKPRG